MCVSEHDLCGTAPVETRLGCWIPWSQGTDHFEPSVKGSGDLVILVPSEEQQAFFTTELQCHPYVFLRQENPLGLGFADWLGLLSRDLQGSVCLYLPSTGSCVLPCFFTFWCWGSSPSPRVCLHNRPFRIPALEMTF